MIRKYLIVVALSFIFCNAWADVMKEPKIIKINDVLHVYENAAKKIIKKVEKDNILENKDGVLKIYKDAPFLNIIIMLYEQAKEKAPDIDKRKFWVFCNENEQYGEVGIYFDKNKKLIDDIIVD